MTPIIEVRGLRKAYRRVLALDGLDLEVAAGAVVGLLGHNGAGKTTLVRILATLVGPDRGHARIAGFDVVAQPNAVRRKIGLAGQNAAVDDTLTGRENLHLIGRLYRQSGRQTRSRTELVLAQFGLQEAARRPVRTYSGGMRRRLDLAASLVARPPVLLLDEPTTGLDPAARRSLWAHVRDLAADGTTVLLTTQYLEEADQLADEVAVLDHGRLIDRGLPAELKRRLGENQVMVTVADPAHLDQTARTLAAISNAAVVTDPDSTSVTVRLKPGSGGLPAVVRLLDEQHIVLADVTVKQPTLEDVYLALTGTAPQESRV